MEKNMSDDTKQNPEVKESPKPELNEAELKEVAGGGIGRLDGAAPEDKGRKEISDFSF
jgi:hypothetical protein